MQGENLQQVRLNRPAIQADALASPGGRGPGRAGAILHDPPIKKEAPLRRFFRFQGTAFIVRVRQNKYKTSHKFEIVSEVCPGLLRDRACAGNTVRGGKRPAPGTKTPGAFLNNATRWPVYGRTSGMRCVIARAERAMDGGFCDFPI